MSNEYSDAWYDTFMDTIPGEHTGAEAAFVERVIPPDNHPLLLDLCCGPGRHALLFAARGYGIVGLDANQRSIAKARRLCPQGCFVAADMRALPLAGETFDGVVNLWHSFGYFDDETNQDILRQVHDVLRPGGRAIFDIYNRDHFMQRPPSESGERAGKVIRTTHSWYGFRHRVELEYDGRVHDVFEWRLYTPEEFAAMCARVGLELILACAWFDESISAGPEHARMQFVLERQL